MIVSMPTPRLDGPDRSNGQTIEREPIRVFMVDDSKTTCLYIARMLASEKDIHFSYCTDPLRCLEMVEEFRPAIILQDLFMPEVDGFELLRQYRKNPHTSSIPVLVLSAEKDSKIKAKAFSLGASDFLTKESDSAEFIARIRYHARRTARLKQEGLGSSSFVLPTKHTVKVFMVDESRVACAVVERLLAGEEGFVFKACSSPQEAVIKAEAFMPTVILQSLSVGGDKGFALLTSFRNNPAFREVPIIILSGLEDSHKKAQALASGADDYIVKTNNHLELVTRLRAHSSKYFDLLQRRFFATALTGTDNGPVKVLMVDDSRTICQAIQHCLHSEKDILFSYCTDPTEALDAVKAFSPTVILQDLEMPEVNGFELLAQYREDTLTKDVPVIVLSSNDKAEVKARAFALGANDYVTKEMDKIELISRIQYHSRGYVNALRLHESIQNLLETERRLELHSNFIRKTFGRYLSDEIVESLLESPEGLALGGEKRRISIMMADLRGFTSLSERLAPEEVLAIINNYLRVMTEILMANEGTIDEFIGDAILAMFGAPILRDNDAQRAVACAIAMQLAMDEVNKWNRQEGYPEVAMGIGINTGEVVVGNIGSERRSKYGIVGRHVNLASRIESYSVGGQILVSASTVEACGSILRIDRQMKVMPKGVADPLTVYAIGGIAGDFNLFLPERNALPLTALDPPFAVRFAVLEGKHAGLQTHSGELVRVSREQAEIRTDISLDLLANIRISLRNRQDEKVTAELYAKVTEFTGDQHYFIATFTARPPEAVAFLAGLIPS